MSRESEFKQLKDYAVAPPAGLFDLVYKQHVAENDMLHQAVSSLKNHQISPPEHLWDKIIAELGLGKKKIETKVIKGNFARKAIAVAAVSLLALGLFWVFNKPTNNDLVVNNPTTSNGAGVQPTEPLPTPPSSNTIATDNTTNTGKANNGKGKAQSFASNARGQRAPQETTSIVLIDGESFTIRNNDLFASFTSFTPKKAPKFLLIDEEPVDYLEVQVDKSTAISISPKMLKMMRKIYKTDSNGVPTPAAVRNKKRLDSWKDSDEQYFDKNVQKNPMNPLDLGDLLF